MSEFDKEAERERLREKYAEDEADRAATKHMSELLLQGMTMTDRHCPECGSPLFRDGERLFCPSCERDVSETDDGAPAQSSGATTPSTTQPESADHGAPSPSTPGEGQPPRANLEVALERAAAAAAAAEDPRTARDYLEAARAAAEALRALDGT